MPAMIIGALAVGEIGRRGMAALSWGWWVWIGILIVVLLISFVIVSPASPEKDAGESPP